MNDFNSEKIINFIQEVFNSKKEIGLHEPTFIGNEKEYLSETIDSTFVSSVGKFVNDFEINISKFINSKYAVATSSGTTALHTALLVSGCDRNTEVITQSLSFVAGLNSILYCGSKPVFIDVDKDSMGMSPQSLINFIKNKCEMRKDNYCWNKTTNKIVRACLPTHIYGFPLRIDKIKEICEDHNIILIEDAAESLGSFYKNKHTGTFGTMGTFSFNGNKIITSGGGGMIVTDDEKIAKTAKHLTTTAKKPHKWEFFHDMVGFNYRMPNLNAALGLAQLENIEVLLERKKKLANLYREWGNKNNIQLASPIEFGEPNNWINILISKNRNERNQILDKTNKSMIYTRPTWNLLHTMPMAVGCQVENIENSKWLEERIVNLPSSAINL